MSDEANQNHKEILGRLHIADHYYCDTGPNQRMEHVNLSGYLTQAQYNELTKVVNTWLKETRRERQAEQKDSTT